MSSANSTSKFTYEHYVCFPDDGNRHEIIDGDHYMNPAPTTYHQSILQRLLVQLFLRVEQAGLGRVFPAPTDVHLSEFDVVQPDIVVIKEARHRIITPTKVKGSPDLLIEVLSPSTRKNDLELKRQLYEREKVGEYWIVNPDDHSLQQLVLHNGVYQERQHGNVVQLTVIEGVSVDLAQVW